MTHVITTYGGGELFTLVFNGIAALFKTDSTGFIMPLIRIGLMVGSVYVVILMLFRSSLEEGLKWLLWVIVATNLLFLPKTTVFIDDPLTKMKTKVDNVPFALGAFASFVSQMGRAVTEKVESVFTLPDYMPYHQTGTVFASSLMSQIGQFQIVDSLFKGNMERFVNQCVVYDAMIGHKYTLSDLQKTPNIWDLVSRNASPVLGFLYKASNSPGAIITCKEGAQRLNKLWTEEIEKATAFYGSRVQNKNLTKNIFFTHLQTGYQLMTGIAENASNILRQALMINALEESSNNKLSELGAASHYAATKALLQQRSAYAIAGEIAARTLPLFKNVIEALSYGLFIFIVILALMPNGYRILLTYGGILLWTQLWAPLYAILNLIMTLYGKAETMGHGAKDGLTLLNSLAIINANADMVTLAAWLSVSIPFISYGILKQGAAAFVGLAQHLGSAMQSAASSAAAETVSGNISLGNVSIGTQAYQNTSAFQHLTSPSYNASQFKALSPSGIEQSTFGDGGQAFSDQALSRLSVQIMGTENTNFAEETHLSQATNLVRSKTIAASQTTESSLQDSTHFLSRMGNEIFRGEDFNKTTSASEATTLQNFKNYVNDIRQSTGLTEAQAVEAAISAGIGVSKIINVGASGSFSSSAQRLQAIENAKSIAAQTGYGESVDKVISAVQSLAQGSRNMEGAEFGTNALASLHRSKGLREELSTAQNQVYTLSQDLASHHSKGLSLNKDLTQEVLEFMAHQPINLGPHGGKEGGRIGYKAARQILEAGGEERAFYLKRFQEQNPQYVIQSVNVPREEKAMANKYEGATQHIRNTFNPAQHYVAHQREIEQRGREANLKTIDPAENSPQGIKSAVTSFHVNVEKKIQEESQALITQEEVLQKAEMDSKTKNMTGAVFKNAFNNVVGDTSPANPIPHDTTPPDSPLYKR